MYAPIGNKSACKLDHTDHHLSFDEIQRAYPDRMRKFMKKEDAEAFAASQPHAFVSRSFNYKSMDLQDVYETIEGKQRHRGCVIRQGAQRQYDGWLVSMVVPFPKWVSQ